VFSLGSRETFQACFNSLLESERFSHLETLACQIVSVFYVLNECDILKEVTIKTPKILHS